MKEVNSSNADVEKIAIFIIIILVQRFLAGRVVKDRLTLHANIAKEAISGTLTKRKYRLVIANDVRNALNSAYWSEILKSIKAMGNSD